MIPDSLQTGVKSSRIGPAAWVVCLTAASLAKIIVGSLYVDGGCLGVRLLPYYFLLGGLLALLPACIAVLTSCCRQSKELEDFWGVVIKVFFVTVGLMIAATVYLLVSASRVRSLDRLCTDQWVPIFGFVMLMADWALFAVFFKLFCVNSVPESTEVTGLHGEYPGQSPFYRWKMRPGYPQPRRGPDRY